MPICFFLPTICLRQGTACAAANAGIPQPDKQIQSRLNMQSVRDSLLKHLRFTVSRRKLNLVKDGSATSSFCRQLCSSAGSSHDEVKARVIGLVKKFDKTEASKVTELADFQKDLSLDSLDRVELVMAFEQEFSIEIPDEQADKLKCCADVANYIMSAPKQEAASEDS